MGSSGLLLWGPRDPVFGEIYLRDIRQRLTRSVLHRYEKASHLLPEDAPEYADAISDWLGGLAAAEFRPQDDSRSPASTTEESPARPSALSRLLARADDDTPAVVEVGGRRITWAELNSRVDSLAAGLAATGLRRGDRVALMVPPSINLTIALYAVWRAGGVIVVADKGLGLRGMGRALRGATIDHLIADTTGLLAARAMRLPGRKIAVRNPSAPVKRIADVQDSWSGLTASGSGHVVPPEGRAEDEAAVLFTSGATGPAKGVLYRHRQIRAQLDLIRATYRFGPDDRIVAAFAPFALYGPALGLPSVVPDIDVTKPATLTAVALARAAAAIDATVVFASPAALRNVVATSDQLTPADRKALAAVRLMISVGASVPERLLREVSGVLPAADLHTPYGMTEALPLTDISYAEIEAAGDGDGVCVGRPLAGVEMAIVPLVPPNDDPAHVADFVRDAGVSGEVWARGRAHAGPI